MPDDGVDNISVGSDIYESGGPPEPVARKSVEEQIYLWLWRILKIIFWTVLISFFLPPCYVEGERSSKVIEIYENNIMQRYIYTEGRMPTLEELHAARSKWQPDSEISKKESYYLYIPDLSLCRAGDTFTVFALNELDCPGFGFFRDTDDGVDYFWYRTMNSDAYSDLRSTEYELSRLGIEYIKYRFYLDQDPSMASVVKEPDVESIMRQYEEK